MVHPDALVNTTSGEALLHCACRAGHTAAVRVLLRCGANVMLLDVSKGPRVAAARRGHRSRWGAGRRWAPF